MTAGGIADNPIELLSHERMKKLLDYLRTEFDTIILDSPPLVPISDAHILTALSDGLILVVRCGRTTYAGMEKAFRNLDRNKLIGVVLNDVKPMLFNTQCCASITTTRTGNTTHTASASSLRAPKPKPIWKSELQLLEAYEHLTDWSSRMFVGLGLQPV